MSHWHKFKVFSWHSNQIEDIDPEDVGYVLSGADGLELMQWTGLVDKDGVEIYDGHIVKYQDNLADCYVEFSEGHFVLNFHNQGFILPLTSEEAKNCRIIGNKFQDA